MWKEIKEYGLNWRAHTNSGAVYLLFTDNTSVTIKIDNPSELLVFSDILRNEKPVHYHTESKELTTGWELLGEEERRSGPVFNP